MVSQSKWGRLGTATAVAALLLGVVNFAYSVRIQQRAQQEDLVAQSWRVAEDYPTEIRPSGESGILSVYWRLLVANNGERDTSLVGFEVREGSGELQGLYQVDLKRLEMPVAIKAGYAVVFLARAGLLLDTKAYVALRQRFGQARSISSAAVTEHVRARGFRLFNDPNGKRILSEEKSQVPQELLVLTLFTSRGARIQTSLLWSVARSDRQTSVVQAIRR